MRQDPSREISENLHLVKITHYTVVDWLLKLLQYRVNVYNYK